jgi:DNA repair exonuclease SbcCD ATPase subunit
MKESVKKLQEEKQILVGKQSEIWKALGSLEQFYNKKETPTCAQETLDLLRNQYDDVKHQIQGFTKAIEGFQSVCTHKNEDGESAMSYDGHDSHKTYYKCSICGYEDDY